MRRLGERSQEREGKMGRNVSVIEFADQARACEMLESRVSVEKENPHPDTAGNHIRWILLFFHPEEEKFTYQIGHCESDARDASVDGANNGLMHALRQIEAAIRVCKPGTIHALALCNVHGLWEFSREFALAQHFRNILAMEQEHAMDLALAIGER